MQSFLHEWPPKVGGDNGALPMVSSDSKQDAPHTLAQIEATLDALARDFPHLIGHGGHLQTDGACNYSATFLLINMRAMNARTQVAICRVTAVVSHMAPNTRIGWYFM